MRAWLYDHLVTDGLLQEYLGGSLAETQRRVIPRRSEDDVNIPKPYIVFGLGNNTNEDLADGGDHEAHRQFFQIWIYDEGGDYTQIDEMIEVIKGRLIGASDRASRVTTVRWLETSAEFHNETYGANFRYVRFQAIISRGSVAA